jgi:hypothetical protein
MDDGGEKFVRGILLKERDRVKTRMIIGGIGGGKEG